MAHNLSHDDSPRPRKKHLHPENTRSLDMHARTMPCPQRTMIGPSISDSGQNILNAGLSASLEEERPTNPASAALLESAVGEFQDWRLPTMDHENEATFVNVPNLAGPGEVYYEAGTFDDFMPGGGSVMQPWDMDIANEMMLDSVQPKKFEAWAR